MKATSSRKKLIVYIYCFRTRRIKSEREEEAEKEGEGKEKKECIREYVNLYCESISNFNVKKGKKNNKK